jgi:hypothetical protein
MERCRRNAQAWKYSDVNIHPIRCHMGFFSGTETSIFRGDSQFSDGLMSRTALDENLFGTGPAPPPVEESRFGYLSHILAIGASAVGAVFAIVECAIQPLTILLFSRMIFVFTFCGLLIASEIYGFAFFAYFRLFFRYWGKGLVLLLIAGFLFGPEGVEMIFALLMAIIGILFFAWSVVVCKSLDGRLLDPHPRNGNTPSAPTNLYWQKAKP